MRELDFIGWPRVAPKRTIYSIALAVHPVME